MKFVIYNELGTLKMTTEENYNRRIRNAREITTWKDFESAEDIINYCIKYLNSKAEDFIVI